MMFGARFTPLASRELADRLVTIPPSAETGISLVVTMNLDHVVSLLRTAAFRDAYANARYVTADGTPIYLLGRLLGLSLVQRVTGADLMVELAQRFRPGSHRLFFLVSSDDVAERLHQHFAAQGFKPDAVSCVVPPRGFETDPAGTEVILRQIAKQDPTHVIMGVGAPKSEIWAHANQQAIGSRYVLCFGASPNYLIGAMRRAPKWARRIGMEWLWRLFTEPRRLAHRYLIASWAFLPAVLLELVGRFPQSSGAADMGYASVASNAQSQPSLPLFVGPGTCSRGVESEAMRI